MKIRTIALIFFLFMLPIALYITFGTKHLAPQNTHPPTQHTAALSNQSVKNTPKNGNGPKNTYPKIRLPITHWTSQNGTEIYFVATPKIPIVDIRITFDAGSARDGSKPGIATLCANALTSGLNNGKTIESIMAQLEDAGALYSAQVDRDKATFSLRSLTDPTRLDPTIALLADLIANPGFPDTQIETIKNQIQVELQQNLQQPGFIAKRAFYETLYPNHPYGHSTTGTPDSINAITKSDLAEFHKQLFVAKNATMTLVGGITEAEAKSIAERITSKLISGNKAAPLPPVVPPTAFIQKNIPFTSEQAHILMGQPCAIQNDPDYFPLLVGNDILGGSSLQSRLFQDIRDKHGLAYSVRSALLLLREPGPFLLFLQTKKDQSDKAINLLKENLNRFINEGPTEKEVEDSKMGFIQSLPLEVSDNKKITTFVSDLAFYQIPLDFLETYSKNIDAITAAKVKTIFEKRIHPQTMTLITVGETSH